MFRPDSCAMHISRVSAYISPTAVQSWTISQNSQISQNSHIARHVPAVCLPAMPCNKAGMDIPRAARITAACPAIAFGDGGCRVTKWGWTSPAP